MMYSMIQVEPAGRAKNVRCPLDECTVAGLSSREDLAAHCKIDHADLGEFEIIERNFTTMEEMEVSSFFYFSNQSQ